jgi:hypothetical protein
MSEAIVRRIPVVASLAYIERVRRLPSTFAATLVPEPGHRYFRHPIAVAAGGEKIGYVAPEVAAQCYDEIVAASEKGPVTCPARRGSSADHATSGVELLLDFTGLGAA